MRYPADHDVHAQDWGPRKNRFACSPASAPLLAGGEHLTAKVFAALPDCGSCGAGVGFDRVDVPAATKTQSCRHDHADSQSCGGGRAHAGPDLRRGPRRCALNDRVLRSGKWIRRTLKPVRGRTIGTGRLGADRPQHGARCVGLGMKVIAYELYPDKEFVRSTGSSWSISRRCSNGPTS